MTRQNWKYVWQKLTFCQYLVNHTPRTSWALSIIYQKCHRTLVVHINKNDTLTHTVHKKRNNTSSNNSPMQSSKISQKRWYFSHLSFIFLFSLTFSPVLRPRTISIIHSLCSFYGHWLQSSCSNTFVQIPFKDQNLPFDSAGTFCSPL